MTSADSTGARAVFLSYASEDSVAAARLADDLRRAGIEVWFDQSELRGGDAWDQTIRQRIRDCRLFVPLISARTDARPEGYFRREWKLAVERMNDMSERIAFLVPVVIDGTVESQADVPEGFRNRQWTRLPGGAASAAFVARLTSLLGSSAVAPAPTATAGKPPAPVPERARRARWLLIPGAIATAVVFATAVVWQLGRAPHPAAGADSAADKSVAVLPFADLSAGRDQEYFSDGLTEQLLDRLAEQPELRVPGRTSSFYYKGRSATLGEIAQGLHVAHVLEGSVRKSGATVRISVQLVQAATGYQVWSKTFDRDVSDVLRVQDEIAAAVVGALRAHLLRDGARRPAAAIDPEAYTAFLQGRALAGHQTAADFKRAIELLTQATERAPTYAIAWAELARARVLAWELFNVGTVRDVRTAALREAEHALELDRSLPEGRATLAQIYLFMDWDIARGEQALDEAERLEPSNPRLARLRASVLMMRGDLARAATHAHRAVALDPLSGDSYWLLGFIENCAGNNAAAERDVRRALELAPTAAQWHASLARILLAAGRPADSLAELEREPDPMYRQTVRPIVLDALGRHAEADQALATAERDYGDTAPDFIARIYGSRGDVARAVQWTERAAALRADAALYFKVDAAMDPVRSDPRYHSLIHQLNLPE